MTNILLNKWVCGRREDNYSFFASIRKLFHDVRSHKEKLLGAVSQQGPRGMEWKENQRLGIGCRFTVMTEMRGPGGHRRKQWCWCSNWKWAQGKCRIPCGKININNLDFLGGSMVKNSPASAGVAGSILGSGRFPGG